MIPANSPDLVSPLRALAPNASQPKAAGVEQEEGGNDVAVQFTSILMSMVVKEMFKTTSMGGDGEGPFGNGPGAEIYRGLAETAFAEALARNGMESLTEEVARYIQGAQHKQETES